MNIHCRHDSPRFAATRFQALVCPSRRRGAAAVEFAVCLPLLLLLVFGSMEASSLIFLKQSLSVAAYEGGREATRAGSNGEQAILRATEILRARGVEDFAIEFPRGDVATVQRGDEVVILVSAPASRNRPLAGPFLADRMLSSRVVMVKE